MFKEAHDVDKPWRLNKRNFPVNETNEEKNVRENNANKKKKTISSRQCLHWKIKANLTSAAATASSCMRNTQI